MLSRNSEYRAFSSKIAVYSARLVGKYLNSSASLAPAAFATCFVVVPLKPSAANSEAAASIKPARHVWPDALVERRGIVVMVFASYVKPHAVTAGGGRCLHSRPTGRVSSAAKVLAVSGTFPQSSTAWGSA